MDADSCSALSNKSSEDCENVWAQVKHEKDCLVVFFLAGLSGQIKETFAVWIVADCLGCSLDLVIGPQHQLVSQVRDKTVTEVDVP